jgi:hypothetical protein
MLIGHEPVVGLLLLSSTYVTRNRLPDHRISPHSAARNRFLYFIVQGEERVREMTGELERGSK